MLQIKQKGQSLIEVAIALGVAAIVISAIVTSTVSSLSAAQYNRDFNLASQYSQEGIEAARSLSGSQYQGQNWCLDANLNFSQSCPSGANINGYFRRTVGFTPNSAKCNSSFTQVTVSTAWTDGKCQGSPFCHSSIISSCVTNI